MTEQEILKKFEELGWKVSCVDDNAILKLEKQHKLKTFIHYHIDIFLKLKSYMFYTATDNQGQFYGLLNMQEHQLLTELFKCWKWIE